MKVAIVCLCLVGLAAAWPVIKSKHHAASASSEEKYDHHSHRYHHHKRHDHVNSHSWERLEHPQNDLASPQQTLYSSEEGVDDPAQPQFPDVPSKSHEDVDSDDDNDSNDTDESDEVTSFPTEIPVTVPFPPYTRGDNAGRGDSVGYRLRAKVALVKASKLHKVAKKV
ncbi:OSTP protein, partial [Turnix velox]|nr:OSTP protein [Turnix velox]